MSCDIEEYSAIDVLMKLQSSDITSEYLALLVISSVIVYIWQL